MSFIKHLMEMNEDREDEIDDLIDQAKQHDNWEVAIQQINMRKNHLAMRRIFSALVDDEKLIVDALARFQDKSKVNESASFTPQEKQQLRDEDISDDLMDKLIAWVIDTDPTWMPYGTQKARDGDPYNWIMDHIHEITPRIVESFITEVKAGPIKNSKMVGNRVKVHGGEHDGKVGVVKRAERSHTFSQMVPWKVEYSIDFDDGTGAYVRRENVTKIK